MPQHALELVLDDRSDGLIRREWTALAAAGLPSQAHHRGATNAPHVTVVSADGLGPEAERAAAVAIGPLLPRTIPLAGVVLFGRGPVTVARSVAFDAHLSVAVEAVTRAVRGEGHRGFVPHITLARRVPVHQVGAVLEVIGATTPDVVTLAHLRRWDPDTRTVHTVS